MELTGQIDVQEKSSAFIAWMDQGMSVLETTLEYISRQQIGGLGVQAPTVESMTAQGHQTGPMGFLHRRSGIDVGEKCSGSMLRVEVLAPSSTLTMMSCSTMWEMESGFQSML